MLLSLHQCPTRSLPNVSMMISENYAFAVGRTSHYIHLFMFSLHECFHLMSFRNEITKKQKRFEERRAHGRQPWDTAMLIGVKYGQSLRPEVR